MKIYKISEFSGDFLMFCGILRGSSHNDNPRRLFGSIKFHGDVLGKNGGFLATHCSMEILTSQRSNF